MALTTGERVFSKVQIGPEVTHGTAVACTANLNMESASTLPDLDRAEASPQEDYGQIAARQPGRAYYGVRLGHLATRGVVRFEDLMPYLDAGLAGGVTGVLSNVAAYTWTYAADNTADTVVSRTIKAGDNINVYQGAYGLVDQLHLLFNALTAPVNAPWQLEASWMVRNWQGGASFDVVSNVASAETPMGHLTTVAIGPIATAFSALTPNAFSLLQFDLTIPTGITTRKEGGTTDSFDSHGRLNRRPAFNLLVQATAADYTAFRADWETPNSSAIVEKRMRIAATGSVIPTSSPAVSKSLIIDGRVHLKAIPIQESNGATVFQVQGEYVSDATLASDIEIAVTNGVATSVG